MRKTILTLLGSVMIAASAAQVAAAAQPHRSHFVDRARAETHPQWRNSYAYAPPRPPVHYDDTPSYNDPSKFGGQSLGITP
jgi:hypothetical protein